jgi:hypothetical protein
MLLGLGLATWMEFYTYDGVNLVLPDMAGTLGLSQDQASWTLHSSRLYEHLHATGPRTLAWTNQAAHFAMSCAGASPAEAHHMAIGLLSQAASRQAATLAFADVFLFMAAVGLVALCCVPLMSPNRRAKQ